MTTNQNYLGHAVAMFYPGATYSYDAGFGFKNWVHAEPEPAPQALVDRWLSAGGLAKIEAGEDLSNSDAMMTRVAEDILDALISKGTLELTDLPAAAQQHLKSRKAHRSVL